MATGRSWQHDGTAAVFCAALLAVMAGVAVATAEDDRAVDDPPPAAQPNNDGNLVDLGENFDANTFEGHGGGFSLHGVGSNAKKTGPGGGPGQESSAAAKVRAVADERFARIDVLCGLTDPQRRKLRLAIESDVRRTVEMIEAGRRKYRGVQTRFNDAAGQKLFQEWQQDVARCREQLRSLCGRDSLVMKALPGTLDAEQHARFLAETEALQACYWQSTVARELIRFDDQLGLDRRQHEELESLLLAARPRLRIVLGARHEPEHLSQAIVFHALSQIDAGRLSSIVSPRQAKLLRQFAQTGANMRSHIESQGLIEKEP